MLIFTYKEVPKHLVNNSYDDDEHVDYKYYQPIWYDSRQHCNIN